MRFGWSGFIKGFCPDYGGKYQTNEEAEAIGDCEFDPVVSVFAAREKAPDPRKGAPRKHADAQRKPAK